MLTVGAYFVVCFMFLLQPLLTIYSIVALCLNVRGVIPGRKLLYTAVMIVPVLVALLLLATAFIAR